MNVYNVYWIIEKFVQLRDVLLVLFYEELLCVIFFEGLKDWMIIYWRIETLKNYMLFFCNFECLVKEVIWNEGFLMGILVGYMGLKCRRLRKPNRWIMFKLFWFKYIWIWGYVCFFYFGGYNRHHSRTKGKL